MDNSRRFTLTDFCVICGVLCILSCILFPRIVQPAVADTATPLASGVGNHGKKVDQYASTAVAVKQPTGTQSGRINLVAYNNTTMIERGLVAQYAVDRAMIVERVDARDKNVDVSSTSNSVVAKFGTIAPGDRLSVTVYYRNAPTVDPKVIAEARRHCAGCL